MFKKHFKTFSYWTSVITIGIILGVSIQFVKAWTEPSTQAPNGNVGAPINTGSGTQNKPGLLGADDLNVLNKILIGTTVSKNFFGGKNFLSVYNSAGVSEVNIGSGSGAAILSLDASSGADWHLQNRGGDFTITKTWVGDKLVIENNGNVKIDSLKHNYDNNAKLCASKEGVIVLCDENNYDWKNTTGSGNYGESCDEWLLRTGQQGINNSAPRSTWSYDIVEQCIYKRNVPGYGITCASSGRTLKDNSFAPTDNCNGDLTQTRRP